MTTASAGGIVGALLLGGVNGFAFVVEEASEVDTAGTLVTGAVAGAVVTGAVVAGVVVAGVVVVVAGMVFAVVDTVVPVAAIPLLVSLEVITGSALICFLSKLMKLVN